MDIRTQSEIRYSLRPNHCKQCARPIELKKHQRPIDVRRKKFCSRSCAASHNNLGVRRHGNPNNLCKCGKKISKYAKTCMDCRDLSAYIKNRIEDRTLGHFINAK